ncbi:MAG: biotin--[Clostridia bacterium]|nr:biotin--[acetyl-CoA-carboxylase] ligase [Clostridia bacterium]
MINYEPVSAGSISRHITNKTISVEYCDCVTSTNTVLKQRAENGEKEGLLLVASEQTAGKGRLGRSFSSQKGTGIYFSLLLRPDLRPADSLLITTCAAVAAAKAIEEVSVKPTAIKWVNDIYMNDRKVAGILTEASFDMQKGRLAYAVLGIGINICFDEIPDEIKDIAGAVFDKNEIVPDAASKIVGKTVDNFMYEYRTLTSKNFLSFYRERDYLENQRIKVIKPTGEREAVANGIDDDFRLLVTYDDGTREYLSTGEVSAKRKGI